MATPVLSFRIDLWEIAFHVAKICGLPRISFPLPTDDRREGDDFSLRLENRVTNKAGARASMSLQEAVRSIAHPRGDMYLGLASCGHTHVTLSDSTRRRH